MAGAKHFDISLEDFCKFQNKANSMTELQELLKEDLNREVSVSTIYYKMTLAKKSGMTLKKYPRKNGIDIDELNKHPSILHVKSPDTSLHTAVN